MYLRQRRVVITGVGVLAPGCIGTDAFWRVNLRGESCISNITCFDTSRHTVKIAGEISGFEPTQFMSPDVARRADRFAQLGIAATRMAIGDSKLDLKHEDAYRVGVCFGSGLGGVLFHEQEMMRVVLRPKMAAEPVSVPKVSPNAIAGHVSIIHGILGPNISISTACASGAHAIGQALDLIRSGRADVVITGGAEAPLTPFTFTAFASLGAMSRRNDNPKEACRPFDKDRDGFVMSEGAGVVVLEELGHAQARKARMYGELLGYGMTGGAYHMVIPRPDGEDAAKAMSLALEDAEVKPEQVSYINAHGTATVQNDKAETLAIKRVFGDRAYAIPVSSTKSLIGHTVGASGAIEVIAGVLAMQNRTIPPTINYKTFDPDCDLDYVPNVARAGDLDLVLSNSFGFGGNNACLILRKLTQ